MAKLNPKTKRFGALCLPSARFRFPASFQTFQSASITLLARRRFVSNPTGVKDPRTRFRRPSNVSIAYVPGSRARVPVSAACQDLVL